MGQGRELQAFLLDGSAEDLCSRNPTYNSYEARYGDGRALIVNYLLVCDGRINSGTAQAGAILDIYFKVAFGARIESPVLGLAITTKQGMTAFGTNTNWNGTNLPASGMNEVKIYHFRVPLDLAPGPWFFELAVASSTTELCDGRRSLFLLELLDNLQYIGIAQLGATFEALSSPSPNPL